MKAEKKHSELSASGSERWLNCPGSVSASRGVPPHESPAALEGTEAHEYLERWLRKVLKHPESNWKNLTPIGLKDNDNMYQAVKIAVAHVIENYNSKKNELSIEEKVSLYHIHPELAGTADIVIAEPYGLLYVPDYKHGKGHKVTVVSEDENGLKKYNTQLMVYLIGVAKKYHYEFSEYKIGAIQPRASVKDKIRTAPLSIKIIRQYEDYFKRGAERVYAKNPEFFMGDWCYFCPAKDHNCPLQNKLRVDKVKDYFVD